MLSKIYHATVTPVYVWIGNLLGGRAQAGRNARTGRRIRVVANILSLEYIGAAIIVQGWGPFWAGGAAMPSWAIIGLGIGIILNSIGWLISAAANHLKIEQYYDAEMELHVENDELRNTTTKLTGRERKIAMNAARTLHDINSYAGSAIGIATGIPMMLALISVAAYSINPALATLLFIVSRASALLSVVCVWGTNQFRLWAYKKSLDEEMQNYYQLKQQSNAAHFKTIAGIVNDALEELQISPDKKYTSWVKFHCIKALEGAWVEDTLTPSTKTNLVNTLETFLKPFLNSKGEFSRKKLMSIDGPFAKKVSVLDSMYRLESLAFDELSAVLNKTRHQCIQTEVNSSDRLLIYHFKRALLKVEDIEKTKCELQNTVRPQPAMVKTAHGQIFLPYYGARKMVETMVEEHTSKLKIPH